MISKQGSRCGAVRWALKRRRCGGGRTKFQVRWWWGAKEVGLLLIMRLCDLHGQEISSIGRGDNAPVPGKHSRAAAVHHRTRVRVLPFVGGYDDRRIIGRSLDALLDIAHCAGAAIVTPAIKISRIKYYPPSSSSSSSTTPSPHQSIDHIAIEMVLIEQKSKVKDLTNIGVRVIAQCECANSWNPSTG